MKILVVGSGGREHALAWKLKQSPGVDRIFSAPGNAGTEEVGENVEIKAGDVPALARFAKENGVDLTVVGPDDSLAAGIADVFEQEGLRIFGPTKSAARLESSKIFAKELMRARHIPTARAAIFEKQEAASAFIRESRFPIVIKADGLALGKGVIVAKNVEEAEAAVAAMMSEGRFGEAGRRLLIEECLVGSECSLHALVDGATFRMLASARDHKRAFDGDAGPNTGGMGAFSPADNFDAAMAVRFESEVMRPLLDGLREMKVMFRGLLFPGLMITPGGPRVLEFNCRFGDPETQAILPRLKSDLLPLLEATIDGKLADAKIEWDPRPAVTVVMASGGYPEKYEVGKPISGLERAAANDVQIFHAGTGRTGDGIVTSGGRVLAVTAIGETVAAARDRAYAAVAEIHFEGRHFRRDIALAAVSGKIGSH
ncbi:MAG TPA: phosphoribosylamine--glycine ligase [Chthoniobacterales bacterium]|nr:phosphoribosylamine--glycine ligase [Chthoniobacterales bacterium]